MAMNETAQKALVHTVCLRPPLSEMMNEPALDGGGRRPGI